jgi:hypothetical protein
MICIRIPLIICVGKSGFLIYCGGCLENPSEGCIVIESDSTRYLIKSVLH